MSGSKEDEFIFCSMCSEKLRKGALFCWRCKSDQSKVGPPNWTSEKVPAEQAGMSFGRPFDGQKRKVMSFDMYKRSKAEEQKGGCNFRAKKKPKVQECEQVTIMVGIKQLVADDLKTIRGKRLPIVVPKNATYSILLEKAKLKYQAFDRKFDVTKKYVMLYEDGSEAQFMPGDCTQFFELHRYRNEVGKDFKRIVFYLCEAEQYNEYESIDTDDHSDQVLNKQFEDDSIASDEAFARNLDEELNGSLMDRVEAVDSKDNKFSEPTCSHTQSASDPLTTEAMQIKEDPVDPSGQTMTTCKPEHVLQMLAKKVIKEKSFFIVSRRGAPITRVLSLWQRQAKKALPTYQLNVHFSGEEGIDTGAMAQEFLSEVIPNIATDMFPDGSPADSTYHVHNGNFRTCGQLVSVSLAQGGPPPCFLEPCVYDSMVQGVDMVSINNDMLTTKEQELLQEVSLDCKKHTEMIIEHGYTGLIDDQHVGEIVGSLKVSFLNRRALYMNEFMAGMNFYGLTDVIKTHPSACRPLFVNDGSFKDTLVPDANYLMSLMRPHFSEEGCSRRVVEENIMDFFQDCLHLFEDGNIVGHQAAIAWNYEDGGQECSDTQSKEKFQSVDLTVAGVMGWLTGQKHKPVCGSKFSVGVYFNHDCLQQKPDHRVCFPIVGACGKQITFPVAHMTTTDEFRDLFLLAFCKGQAFARP